MVTVTNVRLFTTALAALVATQTGKAVGVGQAPADTTLPYAVLYPLAEGEADGPLNDMVADKELRYQFTSVGATVEQAEGMAHAIAVAVRTNDLVVAGYRVHFVIPDDGTGTVDRDDTLSPPLFYKADVYRIPTTPT